MIKLNPKNRTYVIRYGSGYWNKDITWSYVSRQMATRLNEEEAEAIAKNLRETRQINFVVENTAIKSFGKGQKK